MMKKRMSHMDSNCVELDEEKAMNLSHKVGYMVVGHISKFIEIFYTFCCCNRTLFLMI